MATPSKSSFQTVQVEGFGPIEVPANLSQAQVSTLLKEKILPRLREQAAPPPEPSAFKKEFPQAKRASEVGERTPFQKKAAQRLATLQTETAKADFERDIADARTKAAKTLSAAIPVAATLATGGMAAPVAMGVMGSAGLAGGAMGQAAAFGTGSSEIPESGKELVRSLGVDALWATLGEGAGRGIAATAKYIGKKALVPMIARSAAKSDAGQELLDSHAVEILNKLRDVADKSGKPMVNLRNELTELAQGLGRRRTGTSETWKDIWEQIQGKMLKNPNGIMGHQKLADLVEIQELVSTKAWKKAGLNYEEKTLLKKFSMGVRQKIADKYGEIGGEQGRQLFEDLKFNRSQIERIKDAHDMAEKVGKAWVWRLGYHSPSLIGGGLGGATGGQYGYGHGGVTGMLAGATMGTIAGSAVGAFPRKVAPIILERLYSNPATAKMANQALDAVEVGKASQGLRIMGRAIYQSGILDSLKGYLKEVAQPEVVEPAP